jgi:hypothetical protein
MSGSVEERVAAGVAWLDEHVPDWLGRIDLNRLELAACTQCVLGQLFGDYNDAPSDASNRGELLGFDRALAAADWDSLSGHELSGAVSSEYRSLNAEWRRVIESRRASAVIDHG